MQADAAPLLAEVEQQAPLHRAEPAQRHLQLVAAIAAQRSERVAGEALRVQPGRDVLGAEDVAADDRDVLLLVAVVPEGDDPEIPEAGRAGRRPPPP